MRVLLAKVSEVWSHAGARLGRRARGLLAAALAFACGASLAYALRRDGRANVQTRRAASHSPAKAQATPQPSPTPCAGATQAEAVNPDYSEEEERSILALEEWKRLHAGVPLQLDYAPAPDDSQLSESKVVVTPSGRTLASSGVTLHMLDARGRLVWKYAASQPFIDFAYVEATGTVCATAYDNNMFILDAATGRELYSNSRNGRAGYGDVLLYGDDVCLVTDELSGYNADYRAGHEPMRDGVTAWRGTRMLWESEVPPGAELQVVGRKIFAVTKTRTRILLRELKVPKGAR